MSRTCDSQSRTETGQRLSRHSADTDRDRGMVGMYNVVLWRCGSVTDAPRDREDVCLYLCVAD